MTDDFSLSNPHSKKGSFGDPSGRRRPSRRHFAIARPDTFSMDGRSVALPAAGLQRGDALRSMRTILAEHETIGMNASDDKVLLRWLMLHRWNPKSAAAAYLASRSQQRVSGGDSRKPSRQASPNASPQASRKASPMPSPKETASSAPGAPPSLSLPARVVSWKGIRPISDAFRRAMCSATPAAANAGRAA